MAQNPRKYSTTSIKQVTNKPLSRNLWRYALLFLAGMLVGWFVLGYWLFPIRYTQVYPNELHTDARNEYFQMVAEGYALTGDRIRAAQRLQYWNVDDELPRVINARIQSMESGDPEEAESLRRMAEELHLTQTTAIPKAPSQTLSEAGGDIGRTILLFLGGVLVLVLLWALYRRVLAPRTSAVPQRAATPRTPAPSSSRPSTPTHAAPPASVSEVDDGGLDIDGEFEDIETLAMPPIEEERRPPVVRERVETVTPPRYQLEPVEETDDEDDFEDDDDWGEQTEDDLGAPAPAPIPSAPVRPDSAPAAPKGRYLFEEVFRFDGRPQFNEIQHIGEAGDYLGEVGLGAGEETKDNQVRTLELWLFDKADIQTKALVLMPLEVYENEEQRLRLVSGSSDASPLNPGEKIRLETRTFAVDGEVRRVDFGPVVGGVPSIHYAELFLRCRRLADGGVDKVE